MSRLIVVGQLHSEREPITDVAAVYFVQPTQQNIERIALDCKNRLYRGFYINFISRIERPMLELLAQRMIEHHTVSAIKQVGRPLSLR